MGLNFSNMNIDEILNRYSLTFQKRLKKTEFKEVFLLKGNYHNKYILKIYLKNVNSKSQQMEKNFLRKIKNKKFDFLIFPEILACGKNFLLTNYIHRIEYDKATIRKRKWTTDNITLIVSALKEFQNIQIPSRYFSIKQRLLDPFLPVIKLAIFIPKIKKKINISQKNIYKLIYRYLYMYPQYTKTLSHNDLQISNFTFHNDYKKMSMIDFERLHFFADPLMDVLNYLVTASYKIENWTFQSKILKEYLSFVVTKKIINRALADRIKLILLFYCCSYFLSVKNIEIKNSYFENIKFLSSDFSYNKWIDFLS